MEVIPSQEIEPSFVDPIAIKLAQQKPVNGERVLAATDIDDTWKLFFKSLSKDKVSSIQNSVDGMMRMFRRYVGLTSDNINEIASLIKSTDISQFQDKDPVFIAFADKIKGALNPLYRQATERMRIKLAENNVPVVAVTGRDLNRVLQDKDLYIDGRAHFDGIFAAVGTEFYVAQEQPDGTVKYVMHPKWDEMVRAKGFNYETILQTCEAVLAPSQSDKAIDPLEDIHAGKWNLTLPANYRMANVEAWKKYNADPAHQPKPNLEPPQQYKISLYCDYESPEQEKELRSLIEPKLRDAGYNGEIVISHDPQWGRYNIDIVPVTKKDAIHFLDEQYGKEYSSRVFYADNSENGQDALLAYGGVMVGGSTPGLNNSVNSQPQLRTSQLFPDSDFTVYPSPGNGEQRVIMKGRHDEGPVSLLRAFRAFEIWSKLMDMREKKGDIALDKEDLYNVAKGKF